MITTHFMVCCGQPPVLIQSINASAASQAGTGAIGLIPPAFAGGAPALRVGMAYAVLLVGRP